MTFSSKSSSHTLWSIAAGAALIGSTLAQTSLSLDLTSSDSIKSAARTVAYEMMSQYNGNLPGNTPGILPGEGTPNGYYWWEGGAMFTMMMDYWYFTGDDKYNAIVTQGVQFQVGAQANFQPQNQTLDLGNDDQSFWAFAAMTAAELKFPNPPANEPQWLALAQAVFNVQAGRWDAATCGGGMRWQFDQFNAGYTYKNSISNGCFMNLAARLGKYTGNQTYLDYAERSWNWLTAVGLVDQQFYVYDGTSIDQNCTQVDHLQWTYNAGVLLLATAAMWNATQDDKWKTATQGLITGAQVFFPAPANNIVSEVACEPGKNCNTDQLSFKGYLIRWMGDTAKIAPWSAPSLMPKIQATAAAAAAVCSCDGTQGKCGFSWLNGQCDGLYGVGQQMDALAAIQMNLQNETAGPANQTTGVSIGNAGAGTGSGNANLNTYSAITGGDRAGAGILSVLIVVAILGGAVWMII